MIGLLIGRTLFIEDVLYLNCYIRDAGSCELPEKMLDLEILKISWWGVFFLFLAPAGDSKPAGPILIFFLTLRG